MNMRRELMDFPLLNLNMILPNVFSYTLLQLALDQADEILNQFGEPRGSICTVKDYAVLIYIIVVSMKINWNLH